MSVTLVSGIDNIDQQEWEELVAAHSQRSIFQTPQMYTLFARTARYEPVILAVRNGRRLVGVLLGVTQQEHSGVLGRFSARTVVWGGPLVREDIEHQASIADLLIKAVVEAVKRKSIYVEFRNLFDVARLRDVFARNGFEYSEHLNYIVDTTDEEEARQRMSSSRRRQVRKSLKSGAEVVAPQSIEDVRAFYRILKDLYETRVQKPLPDWSFFENFYRLGQTHDLGRYFLVRYRGEIVGGIMCPILEKTAIYEWYICGEDRKYKKVYPSALATWAPIEYAARNGIQYFDFMGAGKPDQDYGVREFKARFGGELVSYGRYLRINSPTLYKIAQRGLALRNRLRAVNGGRKCLTCGD